MSNQWLDIKLDEYEKHMSMPSIRQSQYLLEYFCKVIEVYKSKPESVALIGCSGGNGLQIINLEDVERIVCVDINENFFEVEENRYSNFFKETEFIRSGITSQ